jgi:anti-sigma B factor antagonist
MAEQGESRRSDVLDIEAHADGTHTTLTLVGEFDLSGSDRFWSFLSEALTAAPRSVTIDASGLEFIIVGLMALLHARDAVVEAGAEFQIRDPSPALRRIVEATGVQDLLSAD